MRIVFLVQVQSLIAPSHNRAKNVFKAALLLQLFDRLNG